MFRNSYGEVYSGDERWRGLAGTQGRDVHLGEDSTYIRRAPYFDDMGLKPRAVEDIKGARVLAVLGDSVTTDHISPPARSRKTVPPENI